MSNALENTSIKNWLIHWNRAEPSGVSSLRVSRKKPSTCRVKRSNQVLREKKNNFLSDSITFKDSRLPHHPQGLIQQANDKDCTVWPRSPHSAPGLFSSSFNGEQRYCMNSVFINGFSCKINFLFLEVFPLPFRQMTSPIQVECASQVVKPYSNACEYLFIYCFYGSRRKKISHFETSLNFFK